MIPIQKMFPRNCNVVGDERFPSALVARGIGAGVSPAFPNGACGSIGFLSHLGNEGYIYVDGLQPSQVRWGSVNEVTTNPVGGVAIGLAITHPALPSVPVQRYPAGWCVYGSPRVTSSVYLKGAYTLALAGGTWLPPAIGLMNNPGLDIRYLFMLDTGISVDLHLGAEADYLAGGGSSTLVATIAPSGPNPSPSGGLINWDMVRVEGRSTMSDDWRGINGPVVVQTNGQSAAIGFLTDDFQGTTALYIDPVAKTVKTDDLFTWYNWSNLNLP